MPDALAEDPADPSPVLDLRAVAAAMSSLSARAVHADGSPLDDLVAAALDLVPGTRWASVTTLRRGRFSTRAATDQVAVRADVLQYELGAGPCSTPSSTIRSTSPVTWATTRGGWRGVGASPQSWA